MANTELISEDSNKLLEEVKGYLESINVQFVVTNEVEKSNLVELGNSLQKNWKKIEDQRKKEKKVWDDKGKEVQTVFVPVLDKIEKVKSAAANAITIWNRQVEIERQKKQAELQDRANKERARLEGLSLSQAERADMYRDKANANRKAAETCEDAALRTLLLREAYYYDSKVAEFEAKSEINLSVAQTTTAAIVEPEEKSTSKGERKISDYQVEVLNEAEFINYCVETSQFHFLEIQLPKVKARIKETEGSVKLPGIHFQAIEKVSFSGR